MLNMDDFPAPFGPSSAKTSPFLTQKVFLFTAATPLEYTLYRESDLIGYS